VLSLLGLVTVMEEAEERAGTGVDGNPFQMTHISTSFSLPIIEQKQKITGRDAT
jgi:hypothetical protein